MRVYPGGSRGLGSRAGPGLAKPARVAPRQSGEALRSSRVVQRRLSGAAGVGPRCVRVRLGGWLQRLCGRLRRRPASLAILGATIAAAVVVAACLDLQDASGEGFKRVGLVVL